MPFKSKSQMRKFAILEKEGKLPQGTFDRWAKETPNTAKLPHRAAKPSKAIKRAVKGTK